MLKVPALQSSVPLWWNSLPRDTSPAEALHFFYDIHYLAPKQHYILQYKEEKVPMLRYS